MINVSSTSALHIYSTCFCSEVVFSHGDKFYIESHSQQQIYYVSISIFLTTSPKTYTIQESHHLGLFNN